MSDTGAGSNDVPNIKIEPTTEPKAVGESPSAPPPKRIFVPNVGVKREKKDVYIHFSNLMMSQNRVLLYFYFFSAPEVDQSASNANKNRRQFQPNVSDRGRGRGGRQPNVIVTSSVFEAGPAESTKRCMSLVIQFEKCIAKNPSNL
jgi:hypothetical protein